MTLSESDIFLGCHRVAIHGASSLSITGRDDLAATVCPLATTMVPEVFNDVKVDFFAL